MFKLRFFNNFPLSIQRCWLCESTTIGILIDRLLFNFPSFLFIPMQVETSCCSSRTNCVLITFTCSSRESHFSSTRSTRLENISRDQLFQYDACFFRLGSYFFSTYRNSSTYHCFMQCGECTFHCFSVHCAAAFSLLAADFWHLLRKEVPQEAINTAKHVHKMMLYSLGFAISEPEELF